METYKTVMVAVDILEPRDELLERARCIAKRHKAKLYVVHVVDFVPTEVGTESLLVPAVMPCTHDDEECTERLRQFTMSLDYDNAQAVVLRGELKAELLEFMNAKSVDLVILGSHERHGLSALIGGPEDAIFHRAPCDVLAVRLQSAA